MSLRRAIYPGSFDPVTAGHVDVINRATQLFDRVIVAVTDNTGKIPTLTPAERLRLLRGSLHRNPTVKVEYFHGLLVNYLRKKKVRVIIRGLRAVSDFEYEFQMALMNRKLYPDVETVFLMPAEEYTYLSSSMVKEIVRLGGVTPGLVSRETYTLLRKKFNRKP